MAAFLHKHFTRYLRRAVLLFLVVELLSGCGNIDVPALFNKKPADPELMMPKVLAVLPHDQGSFTEGLVWHEGFLYESSGLYGKSNLRKVDPQTGLVVQRKDDPSQIFSEGLALDGDRLFSLPGTRILAIYTMWMTSRKLELFLMLVKAGDSVLMVNTSLCQTAAPSSTEEIQKLLPLSIAFRLCKTANQSTC